MPRNNQKVVPQSAQALDQLKQQIASQLGIPNYQGYLGDVPSKVNGAVGGNITRQLVAIAEQQLAGGTFPQA